MAEITSKERLGFSAEKTASVGKWVILSGTATYGLSELANLIGQFELPSWAVLSIYFVVNVLTYAIAKYIEGQDK